MSAGPFVSASLRRLVRDRTAMFFVVALPIVVILVIGITVRGFNSFRVGVVLPPSSGPATHELTAALDADPSLDIRTVPDVATGRTELRRGEISGLVVIPSRYDAVATGGGTLRIPVVASAAGSDQQAVVAAVSAVVAHQAARMQAARFTASVTDTPLDVALARATRLQPSNSVVGVRSELVNRSSVLPSGFSYSAPTMLVLFVFINALAGGSAIIQARKLGIYDRAMAAPIHARSIVIGEAGASLSVALLQSVLIVAVGGLIFGVQWGNPLAAIVLVIVWALVGTGAGVLSGTLFRTPEQASAIGPAIGIAFGMLGGCMWPLEIVTPAMRTIGHLVPQAWAVDAWSVLLSRGGDLAAIGKQISILAAFAVVLLAVASARLHSTLTS